MVHVRELLNRRMHTWNMMKSDERFKDIVFKIDETDGHAFKKMHVRAREEIVNLSLEEDINPNELTGKRLSPEEWFKQMQDEDTIVIDARNDYEFDLRTFPRSSST